MLLKIILQRFKTPQLRWKLQCHLAQQESSPEHLRSSATSKIESKSWTIQGDPYRSAIKNITKRPPQTGPRLRLRLPTARPRPAAPRLVRAAPAAIAARPVCHCQLNSDSPILARKLNLNTSDRSFTDIKKLLAAKHTEKLHPTSCTKNSADAPSAPISCPRFSTRGPTPGMQKAPLS